MQPETEILRRFPWQDLAAQDAFESWCEVKIRASERLSNLPPVRLDSLPSGGASALSELKRRCAIANFARYEVAARAPTPEQDCAALTQFPHNLGLSSTEEHRSAGDLGVVALRTSSAPSKRGYIPYTARPLNWHTDGDYNPAEAPVQAFVLHCHQQAESGGETQLADPELAYLRMRAANPDFVAALMHPLAMTIPENREADGTLRPASVGPVFFADPTSGRLQMRYTARTRSIEWRPDPTTRRATGWLRDWLASGDPMIHSFRLAPGQGVLSNNVLHNRTGFDDGAGPDHARVMLRIRFHHRLSEDHDGTA